jgi:hypothetical protein
VIISNSSLYIRRPNNTAPNVHLQLQSPTPPNATHHGRHTLPACLPCVAVPAAAAAAAAPIAALDPCSRSALTPRSPLRTCDVNQDYPGHFETFKPSDFALKRHSTDTHRNSPSDWRAWSLLLLLECQPIAVRACSPDLHSRLWSQPVGHVASFATERWTPRCPASILQPLLPGQPHCRASPGPIPFKHFLDFVASVRLGKEVRKVPIHFRFGRLLRVVT